MWIAYAWQDSIWLIDADGLNPRRLTMPTGAQVCRPAWSPTGDEIVFSRFGPDGLPGELFVASAFFLAEGAATDQWRVCQRAPLHGPPIPARSSFNG